MTPFRYCILISALIFSQTIQAQINCNEKYFFNLYYQGNAENPATHAVTTPDNGAIIIGENRTTGEPNSNSFITKIGKDGKTVWLKVIKGNQSQSLSTIAKLSDGNFITVGGEANSITVGFFLIKFDGSGNIIWRKDYRIANNGERLSAMIIKEAPGGSILLVGQFLENGLSFSDRPVLMQLDPNGNLIHVKFYTPPTSTSFMFVEDFSIRDGYAYIVGGYYQGFSMKGFMMKAEYSTGNVVWSHYYSFNSEGARFRQILPYKKDNFLVIGPDDVNPKDTSLLFVFDSAGIVKSASYFQYSIPGTSRDYGSAVMTNNDELIWAQTFRKPVYSQSSFSLARIQPEKGIVYNKDFPQANYQPRIISLDYGPDSSLYSAGFKEDAAGAYPMFLGRFSKEGDLGCQSTSISSSFGSGVSGLFNLPMQVTAKTYFVMTTTNTAMSYTFAIDSICSRINLCDTLKLIQQNTVCHANDTLKVKIIKNPQCLSLPAVTFDTRYLQLLSQTDSLLNFKVLLSGTSKISASIQTSCFTFKDSISISNTISTNAILDLGPDTVLCPGNILILHAGNGFTSYSWNSGVTDSILTVITPGVYSVTVTDACGGIFRDTVIVSPHPPIPFDIGPDVSKCNTDTVHITAPSGFINYNWSPNYNISSLTAAAVGVYPLIDTIYNLRAEKSPGCFAYDSIRIFVHKSPAINLGSDKNLCYGDSLILDAGSGFNKYSWNTGATSQKIIAKNAGSYSVIATTSFGCNSADTIRIINVFANPVVILNQDSTLCLGAIRILDAGNFSTYLWNTGDTLRAINVNSAGIFSVIVIDNNGCKGGDTVAITRLLPVPRNFLPADTTVCNYGTTTISATSDFSQYLWSTGATSKSISIITPGLYWLSVQDKNNCSGRDTVIVSSKECIKGFYTPNAFTPNSDGKNDVFKPMLFGQIKTYFFQIYNRFGQPVFETTDPAKGWNGNFKGLPNNSNVFVWICKYQFEGEQVNIVKGTVTLLR